ncbi:MAG: dihydroorotase [Prevotellaceae bacterium]|nr:dihydroorotase [Prevotellaceae bacterium]
MRTLIENATLVNEGQRQRGSLLIEDELIASIYAEREPLPNADLTLDAEGALLLPGVIDDHVHFREPGLTRKATIATESRAALAGGVTSVMDMPNVVPQTTTNALWSERQQMGARESRVNFAYYLGATNDNLEEIKRVDLRRVPGIKLFMGSSTGNMLVCGEERLRLVFRHSPTLIMAHCEDTARINERTHEAREKWGNDPEVSLHTWIRDEEACYRSSALAAQLAREASARLHLAHLTTERELELLGGNVTGEACVGHLLFCQDDYPTLRSAIKVNPSVKRREDREALRQALGDGRISLIATDHAPHLKAEKQGGALGAASGMPLVQYSLVAMLELAEEGVLSVERLVSLMCHEPARLFGIRRRGFLREGYKADLTLVERREWTLEAGDILSKCGWSPLEGRTFHHRVRQTFVNGHLAYDRGKIDDTYRGKALTFGDDER